MQASPYHPGLDRRTIHEIRRALPFRPCYFPLQLSPSGRVGGPGVSRSTPPVLHGDQTTPTRRTSASVIIALVQRQAALGKLLLLRLGRSGAVPPVVGGFSICAARIACLFA